MKQIPGASVWDPALKRMRSITPLLLVSQYAASAGLDVIPFFNKPSALTTNWLVRNFGVGQWEMVPGKVPKHLSIEAWHVLGAIRNPPCHSPRLSSSNGIEKHQTLFRLFVSTR